MFQDRGKSAFLALISILVWENSAAAQGCREVTAVGQPPYSAESYPIPLSLRVNLIFLLKEEMAARGEYDGSLSSHVFTIPLEKQIKRAQARLGHGVTGCITWELVQAYDSQSRIPPSEAAE